MEVRNESGGLIVLSETDGTEYTFSMDNPDPCDLYSFTVTPLCDTVEGETSNVKSAKGYFSFMQFHKHQSSQRLFFMLSSSFPKINLLLIEIKISECYSPYN